MALVPSTELTRARDGLKRFASEFTSGQKAVTVAAAIAVVVGAFAFMSFSGRPNYTPLFTNLQSSDAANITTKLTSDKVPVPTGRRRNHDHGSGQRRRPGAAVALPRPAFRPPAPWACRCSTRRASPAPT